MFFGEDIMSFDVDDVLEKLRIYTDAMEVKAKNERKMRIVKSMIIKSISDDIIAEFMNLTLDDFKKRKIELLEEIEADKKAGEDKYFANLHEKYEADRQAREDWVREEGRKEGRKEIAISMIKNNISNEEISHILNITSDEINLLRDMSLNM